MCGSMVDIQPGTAENSEEKRRNKERRRTKKPQDENMMTCPIPQGGHSNGIGTAYNARAVIYVSFVRIHTL